MKRLAILGLLLTILCGSVSAQTPGGGYASPASGSGGIAPVPGSQVSFGRTVSPLAYGAKWDGKFVYDAAWNNSTQNVTFPNADFTATSADVGKIMFGTTFPATVTPCSGTVCGQVLLAQGTITAVGSANSITVSSTSSAACAPSGSTACGFAAATQDDAADIRLAEAAAWTNNNGQCFALELPSGMAMVGSAVLGTVPSVSGSGTACGNANSGVGVDALQAGPIAWGQGMIATTLMPTPNFNFATCTLGTGATACFGGAYGATYQGFTINGLGNMLNGTTHANYIFEISNIPGGPCSNTGASNISIGQWGLVSTSLVGFHVDGICGPGPLINIAVQSAGSTECRIDLSGSPGSNLSATGMVCIGGQINNLVINGGSQAFNSYSGEFGYGTGSTVNYVLPCGGWNSNGDIFPQFTNTVNGLIVVTGCVANVTLTNENITLVPNSGSTSILLAILGNAGTTIKLLNTTVVGTGTHGQLLSLSANNSLFDLGGNTFTSGSVADTVSGNLYGSYSVTGTNNVAANMVLSAGWGTTAAWTLVNGTTQYTTGTITASGTGQAANPTIVYTFPTKFPFGVAPSGCFGLQVGGTQAAVANPFTPSSLSATGVTLTYNGTPGAGSTLAVQIECWRM